MHAFFFKQQLLSLFNSLHHGIAFPGIELPIIRFHFRIPGYWVCYEFIYNVPNVIYDKEKLQLYIESHFFRNIIHSSMVYMSLICCISCSLNLQKSWIVWDFIYKPCCSTYVLGTIHCQQMTKSLTFPCKL